MTYIFMMQTTVGGLSWQYEVTMASDELVLGYAKRVMQTDPAVRTCMALLVFRKDPDTLIGEFVLDAPVARQVVRDAQGRQVRS